MIINQTSVNTGSAVPLPELKNFVKEDRDINDSLIESIGDSMEKEFENKTAHILTEKDYEMKLEKFEDCKIPYKPVSTGSVEISYIDEDSTQQTLNSDKYELYDDNHIEVEFDNDLPTTSDDKYPVTISFTAGYETVDDDLQLVIKLLTLFYFRRDIKDSQDPLQFPMIKNIINNYRARFFK